MTSNQACGPTNTLRYSVYDNNPDGMRLIHQTSSRYVASWILTQIPAGYVAYDTRTGEQL